MANKLKGGLSEKVEEIKRMQANWMKQRSMGLDDKDVRSDNASSTGTRKSRNRSTNASKAKQGSDQISWSVGNAPKKKPPSSSNPPKPSNKQVLRTRSASPARGVSKPAKTSSTSAAKSLQSGSRPASARSSVSEGSRPPSGRSSRSEKGERGQTKHDNSIGRDSVNAPGRSGVDGYEERLGVLSHRVNSEPNLDTVGRSHEHTASFSRHYQGNGDSVMERGDDVHNSQSTHREMHNGGSDRANIDYNSGSSHIQSGQIQTAQSGERKATLDPDAFDRLANQIASRVKAEMREERRGVLHEVGLTSSVLHDEAESEDGGRIEGHHCTRCRQLMVPPDHAPTILAPCGHTFCEACAEDRIKCPTCRTKVTSASLNATLQEVIMASSRHRGQHSITNKSQALPNHNNPFNAQDPAPIHPTNRHAANQRTEYTPANYANQDPSHSRLRPDIGQGVMGAEDSRTRDERGSVDGRGRGDGAHRRRLSPEEEARRLEEEFQSLGIRCEALESEEGDVLERVEKQKREIAQHKQQMGSIAQKQQQLRDEMKSLETRLADLETHRLEYRRQVDDAEDRKKEELDQLAMVRTMLRDMQRNRDRVKMSARKLNLSLD